MNDQLLRKLLLKERFPLSLPPPSHGPAAGQAKGSPDMKGRAIVSGSRTCPGLVVGGRRLSAKVRRRLIEGWECKALSSSTISPKGGLAVRSHVRNYQALSLSLSDPELFSQKARRRKAVVRKGTVKKAATD